MIVQGIASQAMAMQADKLRVEYGVRMTKMALDTMETTGESVVSILLELMELYDFLGQNVNTKA